MAKAHFSADGWVDEPQVGDRMLCGWVPNRLPNRHNQPRSILNLCGNCARLDPHAVKFWREQLEQTRYKQDDASQEDP